MCYHNSMNEKMNLYVMRHGTTVWNERGITQGHSQNRLSSAGKNLVEKIAEKYKKQKFDLIVVSPLFRTVQTANIMNQYHSVKIIKDDLLLEIEQGIFTGRNNKSLTEEERLLKKQRSKKAKMESFEECFERVKCFMENLKSKYNCQNLLIITHNCVATFIENIVLNKKINFEDKKFVVNFENAELKRFEF